MIEQAKFRQSLRSLQDVMVLARKMAQERSDHDSIARLLDRAEYLPTLILDEEDTTEEFRDNLAEIAEEYSWRILLDRFDEETDEAAPATEREGQHVR